MMNRRNTKHACTMLLVSAFCIAAVGCNGDSTKKGNARKANNAVTKTSRSQNLIRNAMTRLDPARLGISARPNAAAMALNDWFKRYAVDDWSQEWPDVGALVGEEFASRVSGQRFTETDAEFIRTSLLLRAYARAIEAGTENERVVKLFYAVIRDVALSDGEPLALTPFEVLLSGRGTPGDRAWLFAAALRQLRIDAFVITPKDANVSGWLVGVAGGDSVMLFDTALGLPIFRPSDNTDGVLPMKPASFADLAGDDEILGGMSVAGHEYPLKDADLAAPRVHLIGEPSLWAQRSLLLQDSLSGDSLAVICDPLHDIDDTPGVRSRLTNCGDGAWTTEDVGVWDYPLKQLNGFAHMTESEQGRLAELMDPFKARVRREYTEDSVEFQSPAWELFKGRVSQLQGEIGESISMGYQNIRLGKLDREITRDGVATKLRIPEEFYLIHLRAAEHATMWVAVHQYRVESFGAAIDAWHGLRRQFADGVWTNHTDYLLGLAHAQSGQMTPAIRRIAAAATVNNAQTAGNLLLHARWTAAHPDAASATDDNEAEDAAVPPGEKDENQQGADKASGPPPSADKAGADPASGGN